MKSQYKEAYRVARLLSHMVLAEQLSFIATLKWNFTIDTYLNARNSFTVTARRAV